MRLSTLSAAVSVAFLTVAARASADAVLVNPSGALDVTRGTSITFQLTDIVSTSLYADPVNGYTATLFEQISALRQTSATTWEIDWDLVPLDDCRLQSDFYARDRVDDIFHPSHAALFNVVDCVPIVPPCVRDCTPTTVPEPGAWLLVASGLLWRVRRWRS